MPRQYLRGQIYCSRLDPVVGHEQGGRRPVLISQNDAGRRWRPVQSAGRSGHHDQPGLVHLQATTNPPTSSSIT